MLSLAVLTAALLAASSQAHPASSLAVAVVKEQFTQAKLVPVSLEGRIDSSTCSLLTRFIDL